MRVEPQTSPASWLHSRTSRGSSRPEPSPIWPTRKRVRAGRPPGGSSYFDRAVHPGRGGAVHGAEEQVRPGSIERLRKRVRSRGWGAAAGEGRIATRCDVVESADPSPGDGGTNRYSDVSRLEPIAAVAA